MCPKPSCRISTYHNRASGLTGNYDNKAEFRSMVQKNEIRWIFKMSDVFRTASLLSRVQSNLRCKATDLLTLIDVSAAGDLLPSSGTRKRVHKAQGHKHKTSGSLSALLFRFLKTSADPQQPKRRSK